MRIDEVTPGLHPFLLYLSFDQTVPKFQSLSVALLFITDSDCFSLLIIHQRQIDGGRECPFFKFNRCTYINEGYIGKKQRFKVGRLREVQDYALFKLWAPLIPLS